MNCWAVLPSWPLACCHSSDPLGHPVPGRFSSPFQGDISQAFPWNCRREGALGVGRAERRWCSQAVSGGCFSLTFLPHQPGFNKVLPKENRYRFHFQRAVN